MKLFCRSRNNQNDILEAEKKYIYNWFFTRKAIRVWPKPEFHLVFQHYSISTIYPRRKVFRKNKTHRSKPFLSLRVSFLAKQCNSNHQHEWKRKIVCRSRGNLLVISIFLPMQCRNEMKCRTFTAEVNQSRISENRGNEINVSMKRECWVFISTCIVWPMPMNLASYYLSLTYHILPNVNIWLV